MRRKITESEEKPDFADLPDLTEQQKQFVFGILNGLTATDAYKAAYDCSNSGNNTIWVEASRLKNHPSVSLWLSAARKAELGATKRTLEQHIRRLDRLQELCIGTGNMGAAVQAEQLIGKASGHYTEQFRDMTADPAQLLREIANIAPDLANKLAEDNGIAWSITEH